MGKWMRIGQKRKLIEKSEGEPKVTQRELAEWAAREFGLAKAPAHNTVFNILANALAIKDPTYGSAKRRKPLKVTSSSLERKLGDWVAYVEAKKVTLNRKVLTMKAKKIQDEQQGSVQQLALSVGLSSAFMRRHGLRFRIKRGEDGSVDQDVVREGRHRLLELIDLYDLRDIFNMDECGLCISQAPNGDICTKDKPGVKADKTRITIAFSANADGSELLPLMFIGRAARPRCIQKKSGMELGYNYNNNKKAWMTKLLFKKWLRELDSKMRREGRDILLLLDNASAHCALDYHLTNVNVQMLPPNTTACLQLLDAGVIASFKARYRTRQIDRAIERIDDGEDVEGAQAYKVDQSQRCVGARKFGMTRACRSCTIAGNTQDLYCRSGTMRRQNSAAAPI